MKDNYECVPSTEGEFVCRLFEASPEAHGRRRHSVWACLDLDLDRDEPKVPHLRALLA